MPNPITNQKWYLVSLVLVPLSILHIFIRLHYLNMPLFTDYSVYAYMGHALGSGGLLYTNLIDNKPPAVYITYMLAEKIFGYQQSAIVILAIIFSLISLIFLFIILRRMGGLVCAFVGSLFWVLISSTPALHAEFPNTELFINAFILMALWSLLKYFDQKKHFLYIAGIALAIATTYKMNAAFILIALMVYIAFYPVSKKKWPARYFLEPFKLALPTFLLWGIIYIYFSFQNRFDDMYLILFTAMKQYAGNIWMNEWDFIRKTRFLFIPALKEIWILLAISYLWIVSVWRIKPGYPWKLNLFVAAGVLVMIGSLRTGSPHYYQVLLPVTCILSALFIGQLLEWQGIHLFIGRGIGIMLLAVSLGGLSYYQIIYLKNTPEEITVKNYGYSPLDDRNLGRILKSITLPKETIYQWGLSPAIYFYSRRNASSGILLNQVFFFAEKKYAELLYAKLVREIRESLPAFYIFTSWNARLMDEDLFRVIKKNYSFFGMYGKYVIYERKNRPERFERELFKYRNISEPEIKPWENVQLRLAAQTQPLAMFRNINVPPEPFDRQMFIPKDGDPDKSLVEKGLEMYKNNDLYHAEGLWRSLAESNPYNYAALANTGLLYEKYKVYYRALANYQAVAKVYEHPWTEYYQETRFLLCRDAEEVLRQP